MLTMLIFKIKNTPGISLRSVSSSNGIVSMINIKVNSTKDIPKWDYFISSTFEKVPEMGIKRLDSDISFRFPEEKNEEILNSFEKEWDKGKFKIYEPEEDHLTIIAKVTNLCNLNCEYCYDKPFREKLGHNGIIKMEKLDKMLDMATKYAKAVKIIFHGGEPSLAGTDFYRKFLEEVLPKYPYCDISLNMQTNGTNFNEEWFEMFNAYNESHEGTFSIGTSFNALAEKLRFSDGISEAVLKNMLKAKEYGYCSGIGAIDVVTKESHKMMKDIYEFYKEKGLAASFNLVNESGAAVGKDMVFRSKEDQKKYLKDTREYFTYWLNDPDESVYYDRYAGLFTEILITGGTICEFGSDCVGRWIGINSNGDLYPCDRALHNKYRIGNVSEFESVGDILNAPAFKNLRGERNDKFLNYCSNCSFFNYCHLNCPMKDIDLYDSADKPNEIECQMLRLSLTAAYEALFDIDIESCNLIARTFFIKNCVILPREIPKFLKEIGIEDVYKGLDFSVPKKMFGAEFEVFRLLNGTPGEEGVITRDYNMSNSDREIYLPDDRFNRLKEALKERAEVLSSQIEGEH